MDLKTKKSILEVFGIFRMILGIGQIIALCAAYFLLEFIVQYPKGLELLIIDEQVLVLSYTAILMRSVFHTVAGIGIAKIQDWVRPWIAYGWAIMVIVATGLVYSLFSSWQVDGYVDGIGEVFNWNNCIVYFVFIMVDLFFVIPTIGFFNRQTNIDETIGLRLGVQKISGIFFVTILVFSSLFFLGQPVKQGFHQGYYKTRGQRADEGLNVKILEKRKPARDLSDSSGGLTKTDMTKRNRIVLPTSDSKKRKIKERNPESSVVRDLKSTVMIIDAGEIKGAPIRRIKAQKKQMTAGGIPYIFVIGLFAGFCINTALLMQFLEIQRKGSSVFAVTYVLLTLGFLFLTFYSYIMNLTAISLTSCISAVLSAAIIIKNHKNEV